MLGSRDVCFHVRRALEPGYVEVIDPGFAGLEYLSLGVLTLGEGAEYALSTAGREAGLVVLGGRCRVEAGESVLWEVGGRPDVFSGKAHAVYLPPQTEVRVTALTGLEAAVCWCRVEEGGKPVLVGPEAVREKSVGRGNWARTVYDIIYEDNVDARRLVLGETVNPPGNWSSAPPHKHDADDPPNEAELEEIYFFKVEPRQGFGIQRLYNKRDFDVAYTVKDGDAVAIPEGYHPVVAGPGYRLYYLWFLAGRGRRLHPRTDPDHAWVEEEAV